MAQRLMERGHAVEGTKLVYEVTDRRANHGSGEEIARARGGRLILLRELVADGDLLDKVRGEWVLLGDSGTSMKGLKIVNADGPTALSMFTPASRARPERFHGLKAYFHPARGNLSVYVGDGMLVVRQFGVPGSKLGMATPVVVIARPPIVEAKLRVDREILDNLGTAVRRIERGQIEDGLEVLKAVQRSLEGQ